MYSEITDIFFDLDHTLWDFDKNSEIAFGIIFKDILPEINVVDFTEVYTPINQACWKLYQKNEITHEQLRYTRLKQSFEVLNIEISDELIHIISDDYIAHLPNSNFLFEGTLEILDYLKSKYKLHIITNGFAEVQYKKLNNSGISSYFETITNSEMAGAKKPNPIIFEHALQQANVDKNNAIMIGDCIDADVNGAINFGMKAIFFNPNATDVSNNSIQIQKLVELKNIF